VPGSAFFVLTPLAAGTHTLEFAIQTGTSSSVQVDHLVLVAYEI
jgi:hypothetical protein